jgi:hypothetical protein
MENRSNAVVAAGGATAANSVLRIWEEQRFARQARKDLQIGGTPRTNLLLMGTADGIGIVLEMLRLEHREPILRWHPGQPLELPSPGRAATLVLHDVSELTSDDQHRVLRWLDQAARQIRVVSTTAVPLWPRVETGAFNDMLYYRLNTVCVDLEM